MEAPFILFDHTSLNNDSPVFQLDGQHTVVAVGMQPDDVITFEVITIAEAARDKICGCRIVGGLTASVEGMQRLLCPTCESEDLRPVTLTAKNPVVVLDAPHNSFLRAIYSGTGIGMQSVNAWVTKSATTDLTDAMRGCPPVCCEDEEETWSPSGLHRCNVNTDRVEIEEISNCGNKRWIECGDVEWMPTGNTFCTDAGSSLADGGEGGEGCEVDIDGFNFGPGYYVEQRNQCGQTRWRKVCSPWDNGYYTETGVTTCRLNGGDSEYLSGSVFEQVVNPCGRLSWRYLRLMTFTETGNTRCEYDPEGGEGPSSGDGSYYKEVRDDCGNLHWQYAGNLTWSATGNQRCDVDFIAVEERSTPCGLMRWRTSEVAVLWSPTGNTRCNAGAFEREEQNNCGQTRWQPAGVVTWEPTGNYDCRSNINWREERNQCGELRWINTGASCGTSGHTMIALTPQAENVVEGQTACWNIALDTAVIGTPLVIEFDLSGADQTRNAYSTPRSVTIPVGQSTAVLCIATTDDTAVDGTEQLCVSPRLTARLTNAPSSSCINVLDNDSTGSSHEVTWGGEGPDDVTEGEEACWNIVLDGPVTGSPLNLVFDWQGTDAARNGYPNTTVTIAVGDSTATLCRVTTDDTDIDGTETLCPVLLPNSRVTSGPGARCIDVLDNDVGASVHTITCVTPPAAAVEGTLVCWHIVLDAPVTGTPLTITGVLSGSEQVARGYPNPSVTIPVGQSEGDICVQTIDDNTVEGTKQLCLTISTSSRLTAVNDVSCAGAGGQASIIFTNASGGAITEGNTLNVRVSLSAPAPAGGVSGTIAFSGSEKTAFPAAYPDINWTVAEGFSTADYSVPAYNDALIDGTTSLTGTLTVATSDWTPGVPTATTSVLDNDAGGGGGGGGGDTGCFMAGTMMRTALGYANINGLLPGDELLGFHVPGMPAEYEPGWSGWRASSLAGLSYHSVKIRSVQPFNAQEAISVNGGPPTTPDHRYLVWDGSGYGWYEARRLNSRCSMSTTHGLVAVETVEKLEGNFTFFKLDVENPDTLIAKTPYGDVLAHNVKDSGGIE